MSQTRVEIYMNQDKASLLGVLSEGVESWNNWRREHPNAVLGLGGLQIVNQDLSFIDFSACSLPGSDFSGCKLFRVNLGPNSQRSEGGTLTVSPLTYLEDSKFVGAVLDEVDLTGAILTGASFRRAQLHKVNFAHAKLERTDFTDATIDSVVFADNDLSSAIGLDTVTHLGPSSLGIESIYKSGATIPDSFLRGCGVFENFITYSRSLLGTPIDFYSCFISYSSKDESFANRIYADLRARGLRCWYAPEDLKIGDSLRRSIDRSISLHDKLLLVLSKASIASQWVEQEVETSLLREREENRTILFPVTLDKTIFGIKTGWPALVRNTRHIGDFKNWKKHDHYQKTFDRLIADLKQSQTTESDGRE